MFKIADFPSTARRDGFEQAKLTLVVNEHAQREAATQYSYRDVGDRARQEHAYRDIGGRAALPSCRAGEKKHFDHCNGHTCGMMATATAHIIPFRGMPKRR